jgi:hypothetical protein
MGSGGKRLHGKVSARGRRVGTDLGGSEGSRGSTEHHASVLPESGHSSDALAGD